MIEEARIAVSGGQVWLVKNTKRLAENAPMKIPGAMDVPASNKIANAKPEGGHIGVALEK
jgi:hypothetical protein